MNITVPQVDRIVGENQMFADHFWGISTKPSGGTGRWGSGVNAHVGVEGNTPDSVLLVKSMVSAREFEALYSKEEFGQYRQVMHLNPAEWGNLEGFVRSKRFSSLGGWSAGAQPEDTIAHEFAHGMENITRRTAEREMAESIMDGPNRKAYNAIIDFQRKHFRHGRRVSEYAGTESYELWAESYSVSQMAEWGPRWENNPITLAADKLRKKIERLQRRDDWHR